MPKDLVIPEAICPKHPGVWLEIGRYEYRRGWYCRCKDCYDVDQDYDGKYSVSGEASGDSPLEALEAYADMCDVDPNEILFTEEKHV